MPTKKSKEKMSKSKQTVEENYDDWINLRLCDNEFVQTYSEDILSKPKFVLSSTASEFDKERLYSLNQMLEMFRLGFLSMSKTEFGQQAINKARRPRLVPSPYPVLRQLSIGQKTTFPYNVWRAVRTAASKLHAEFGTTFRVTKLAPNGQVGDIEVTRLS